MLRKVYGPVAYGEKVTNQELINAIQQIENNINVEVVGWNIFSQHFNGSRGAIKVILRKLVLKRTEERPTKRWMANVSNDLEELGERNWRKKADNIKQKYRN